MLSSVSVYKQQLDAKRLYKSRLERDHPAECLIKIDKSA